MSLWKSRATVRAALPLSERRNLPSHHWRMLLPCWMDGKRVEKWRAKRIKDRKATERNKDEETDDKE